MQVQVLGPGCARCKQLVTNAEQAVRSLGLDVAVEKVEDPRAIMQHHVMSTPALVVDGQVKVAGRVPSPAEIQGLLAR